MAKFKPAGGKAKSAPPAPQQGIPCLILLVSGLILVMIALYYVLKTSNS